jgi:endonuclease/exonuclease/phosphatase family metal-dependent hydrolase
MKRILLFGSLLVYAAALGAEEITLGTYNIEYFDRHFLAHRLANQPFASEGAGKEALDELRKKNDEDNWETAQVILDPKFNPDILVVEEGCDQQDLEFFNRRWLSNRFQTVIQFPSNTERRQHLNLLMRPGYKILERRDQYYLEPDPVGNERGSRLFARGPVFVKVQTPGGYQFWVGLTHMKSKSVGAAEGDSAAPRTGDESRVETPQTRQRKVDATKWRNREAARTHQIIKELEKAGPADVILLGDMNDSLGNDAYEGEGGGDAISNLVGSAEDGLILATRPLAEAKRHSFNGYWRTGFRELIDHVIVTRSMKDQLLEVRIIDTGFAPVASDHFPVLVKIKSD